MLATFSCLGPYLRLPAGASGVGTTTLVRQLQLQYTEAFKPQSEERLNCAQTLRESMCYYIFFYSLLFFAFSFSKQLFARCCSYHLQDLGGCW
jgi:hypothetical protein